VLEQGVVLIADAPARRHGVRAGMKRGGVLTLAPGTRLVERDPAREADALRAVALALLRFSPCVALDDEATLIVDVGPSLRLFGGLPSLCRQVRATLAALGYVAPCRPRRPGAARGCSRARRRVRGCGVAWRDRLRSAARSIGCRACCCRMRVRMRAGSTGSAAARSPICAPPRAGLQRRCGPALLAALDRAYGDALEPLAWMTVPPVFDVRLELPERVEYAQAVLFAAQRLVVQLCGWLAARQLSLAAMTFDLEHERGRQAVPPTALELAFAAPVRDEAHFMRLLGERLARVELPAAVIAVRLKATRVESVAPPADDLFPEPGGTRETRARLFELLSARLGADNVLRAARVADHRPEAANRWLPLDAQAGKAAAGPPDAAASRMAAGRAVAAADARRAAGIPYAAQDDVVGRADRRRLVRRAARGARLPRRAGRSGRVLLGVPRAFRKRGRAALVPARPVRVSDDGRANHLAARLRGVVLPLELLVPAWRVACGGARRARRSSAIAASRSPTNARWPARACMSPRRRKGCRSSSARISPSRPMRSRRATIRGPAPSLVLLAQNREGYGNLAELITWRRMAAPKGTYTLTSRMLSAPPAAFAHLRGMPDCFAILVPVYPVRADVLDAQVAWFRATFGERARLGLVQLQRALDGAQREEIRAAGERRGVPVVALGDVTMHRRSCKPLQDVMTAIRVGMPVAECGYALAPNAEQHLRSRQRIGQLYSPDELAQTCEILDACDFELGSLRYEYPDEIVPAGLTPTRYLEQETLAGARALSARGSGEGREADPP
jgi:protein ImuB